MPQLLQNSGRGLCELPHMSFSSGWALRALQGGPRTHFPARPRALATLAAGETERWQLDTQPETQKCRSQPRPGASSRGSLCLQSALPKPSGPALSSQETVGVWVPEVSNWLKSLLMDTLQQPEG